MITYYITTGYTGGRSDKNKLLNYLKYHNLINNKHIPEIYKCNSRENRLKLLAGLIDSDGSYDKVNNSLEITQKNKKLADDILFLVRSLGFRGTMKECTKSCMYKGEKKTGQYHRNYKWKWT
jgi:intein/homing endonuclease